MYLEFEFIFQPFSGRLAPPNFLRAVVKDKNMAAGDERARKETKTLSRALPLQIVVGLAILVGGLYGGYFHIPDDTIPTPSSGELSIKMVYTLRCCLFPATFLGLAVLLTGRNRVKVGAINPLSGNEAAMELHKKRLTNTLEQTFMYVVMAVLLATLLEREEMKYIFLSMVIFLVGRVLFWVGYGIHPAYREAGTIVTYGMVLTSLILCTYLLCSRGLLLGSTASTAASVAVPTLCILGIVL